MFFVDGFLLLIDCYYFVFWGGMSDMHPLARVLFLVAVFVVSLVRVHE